MNSDTLVALKASIERWDGLARTTDLDKVTLSSEDCALCVLHYWPPDGSDTCARCPVRLRTGRIRCRHTPFEKAFANHAYGNLPAFVKYAADEAAFLKSLLPAGEEHAV